MRKKHFKGAFNSPLINLLDTQVQYLAVALFTTKKPSPYIYEDLIFYNVFPIKKKYSLIFKTLWSFQSQIQNV